MWRGVQGAGVFSHVAQQSLAPLSGRKRTKSSTWQTGFVWSVDGWQRQRASDLPARALATGLTHYQTGDTRVTSNARGPELTVGRISPFLTVGVRGSVKCFALPGRRRWEHIASLARKDSSPSIGDRNADGRRQTQTSDGGCSRCAMERLKKPY